jgi:hypothetical protein
MRSRTPAYGLAIPYDQTAAQTITRQQAMVAVACLAVLAVVAVIQPLATAIGLIAVATLAYMAAFVYRMTAFWLSMRGASLPRRMAARLHRARAGLP